MIQLEVSWQQFYRCHFYNGALWEKCFLATGDHFAPVPLLHDNISAKY